MDGKGQISNGNESMEMMANTCWWKSMKEWTRILEELADEITEASLNVTGFVNRKLQNGSHTTSTQWEELHDKGKVWLKVSHGNPSVKEIK